MNLKLIATLSLSTLLLAGTAHGQNVPGQHFMDSWDLDKNGEVTVEEIAERRADIFYTFDEEDDGYLSAQDYEMFDEARANDAAAQKAQGGGYGDTGAVKNPLRGAAGMSLENNDNDGDGRVSLEEFVSNAPAWFEAMDRNGDGVITLADFGPVA